MVALLLSTWIGNGLLDFFGISRAAFQVAGGVIVVLIGLSMLRSKTPPEHHDPESVDRDQNSAVKGVVPLGIPLLAGPGTLTVVIAAPEAATLSGRLGISVVVLLLALVVYLIFSAGERLSSRLSASAVKSAHQGDGFAAHIDCDPDVDHWIAGCVSCSCGCDRKLMEKGWCSQST